VREFLELKIPLEDQHHPAKWPTHSSKRSLPGATMKSTFTRESGKQVGGSQRRRVPTIPTKCKPVPVLLFLTPIETEESSRREMFLLRHYRPQLNTREQHRTTSRLIINTRLACLFLLCIRQGHSFEAKS